MIKKNVFKATKTMKSYSTWSGKAFMSTIVSSTLPSFHEGSLEIKLTVPLKGFKLSPSAEVVIWPQIH